MVSFEDIRRLLSFRAEKPDVASLYLELDAELNHVRLCRALIDEKAAAGAGEDLERIAQYVSEFKRRDHRSLAVFSAPQAGLWQVIALPEAAGSSLRLAKAPHVTPLLNAIEQYQRFGVALVGPEKARFLEVYLGEIEEHPPLPGEADGGTKRPPQNTDSLHRHLKTVADNLIRLSRAKGFDRVILGTTPDLEPLLIRHLHTRLQDNLIVDTQLNVLMTPKEVLGKVLVNETQSRIVRESVLVYRLMDAVDSEGMGVAGLQPTLQALNQGQVRMLLVREGLAKLGRLCPHCGALALSGKKCVYCWRDTKPVMNVVSEMARAALDLNCEVFRILHDKRLDALGGVGAELRFKTEGKPQAAPPSAPVVSPSA